MYNLDIAVEEAIRNHKSELKLLPHITDNNVYMSVRTVMRGNPDVFWFSHQWEYKKEEHKVYFHYTLGKERSEKVKTQIDDVVRNDFGIENVCKLSPVKQMMYVYKWIALYCRYNIHSAHNQTIYSVFVYRNSVCTGIAKAAQYLLHLLGVESKLVFGRMNNSDADSRHCWLIVKIDGNWYHLDPTFAMPGTNCLLHESGVDPMAGLDGLFYNFFCTDTATIKQSRIIEDEETLPCCNDTIDYALYQNIDAAPSRHGHLGGLGCLLSDGGTTADIYLAHDRDYYFEMQSVAKVFRDDLDNDLLCKELKIMRECAGELHLLHATNADFGKGILYIEQATPLTELLTSHYFKLTVKGFCDLLLDIIAGLKELLHHGIVYRDIHLNNIYLTSTIKNGRNVYKLGDFGSCVFTKDDGKYAGLTDKGGVGSKWYMAPETWNSGAFDERSAVYSVGMVAYHLLNNLYPPLWLIHGEKSHELRVNGMQLPMPCKLGRQEYRNLNMMFLKKSICYASADRYNSLSALEDAIHAYVNKSQQYGNLMLIKGGESDSDKRNNTAIDFCSTCFVNTGIEVSNGDSNDIECDVDPDCCETINDDSCDECNNDIIAIDSINDNSSRINDFACTCSAPCKSCEAILSYIPKRNPPKKSHKSPQGKLLEKNQPEENKRISLGRAVGAAIIERICGLIIGGAVGAVAKGTTETVMKEVEVSECENEKVSIKQDLRSPVNSSIFAPSEARCGDYMMVQVFLYQDGEEKAVFRKASEVDPTAQRRNYTPLNVMLKHGDIVKVMLAVTGTGVEIEEPAQELIWNGHYTDCQFGVFVTERFKASTLISTVTLSVNGVPAGRMMFKTTIVSQPRKLYAEIHCKTFNKIFISYSHKDEQRVKYIAEAYRAQRVDYFFDRHYLKGGDVYPVKIRKYINSADLFILCWSKNAAESEYVTLERHQALALAYPQVDIEKATIAIHPISIEPRAEYPEDMKEVYNFEEI